jgi:phosphohistidine phosphatase
LIESRTLILMRHASAGHQGGTRDQDRPLTPAGQRDAAAAGAWISRNVPAVDAVLCSTATRTRQTLAATGISADVRFVDDLYGGGTGDIIGLLQTLPADVRTVLVVGHAPGIPATAALLATTGHANRGGAPDGEPAAERPGDRPVIEDLRYFAAGAIAVLQARAGWAALAEDGADLTGVYLPGE